MQKEHNKKHQEKHNKKHNKNFNKKNIIIAQALCLCLFSLALGFCSDNNSTNNIDINNSNPKDTLPVNDPNKQNDTLSFADVTNNAIIVSLTDPSFTQVATATSTRTGITYTSSEMNIATINASSGEVTILAPGITIITATLAADETPKI